MDVLDRLVHSVRFSLNGLVGSVGLVDSLVGYIRLVGGWGTMEGMCSVGGLVWWDDWLIGSLG